MTADSLDRFHAAQDREHSGFETALEELRTTGKRSHWIWYVFPQLAGLGRSASSERYGVHGLQEAADYLRDPVLRERLLAVTRVVAERLQQGAALDRLMGQAIDSLKLVSSLTLFEHVARSLAAEDGSGECAELARVAGQVLAVAEAQGYSRCSITRRHLEP